MKITNFMKMSTMDVFTFMKKTEDLKQIFKSIIRKRINDSENCPFRFKSFGCASTMFIDVPVVKEWAGL